VPTYSWQALDANGKSKKGFKEADSASSLRQKLRDDGLTPLAVDLSDDSKSSSKKNGSKTANVKKMPLKDVASITKQISTLIKASLPIDSCLQAMVEQTKHVLQKNLLISLRTKINEGHTFAQALEDFPGIFPKFYVSTVSAGEQSGKLGLVLDKLADYLQTGYETRKKITMAMMYPAILTVVAVSVIVLMLVFVMPSIVEVFEGADAQLPGLTVFMITISEFLQEWGFAMLVFFAVVFFIVMTLLKNPSFKNSFQIFLLKIPGYGNIIQEQNTSRFSRTLGILLLSNVDFYEAMRISTSTVDIMPILKSLENATKMVQEGSSIYVSLNKTGYFSPISLNLIASGEKSGTLAHMLEQTSDNQDKEMMDSISTFVGVFEPLITVVMGGIVMAIMMAIMVPIMEMNDLV